MVDVVIAFPPANTETTNEVCNENADDGVGLETVCDAHVPCIMNSEDQLMPE